MIDFKALAEEKFDYVVSMRRHFHKHPELSRKEFETSKRICEELEAMGVEYKAYPDNTVVAIIDTGKPGKTVLVRGDIDALPVQEDTGAEYASCVPNVSHVCGHDTHAAMLLGLAKIFSEIKDEMCGKVLLGFQIAEENLFGSRPLVQYVKELGGADNSIAIHVSCQTDLGTISIVPGPMASGVITYKVTMNGVGGHGSVPHQCKDPIKPACEYVLKLAALPSNIYNAQDPIVFSTGSINAGIAPNVIPEKATVSGTIRYFNKELTADIHEKVEKLAELVAESYGLTASIEYPFNDMIPVENDPEMCKIGWDVVKEMGLNLVSEGKNMGSDDMAIILDAFPGFYAWIGCANEAKGFGHVSNHHPKFDIDEDGMKIGTEFLLRNVFKFLGL